MLYILAIIAIGLIFSVGIYKQKIKEKKQNWLLLGGGIVELILLGIMGGHSATTYSEDILTSGVEIFLMAHSIYIIFISIKGLIRRSKQI